MKNQNQPAEASALDALRQKIESRHCVKKCHKLAPSVDKGIFYYLFETKFETFPKFIVGMTTDDLFKAVTFLECGSFENAAAFWERRVVPNIAAEPSAIRPEIEALHGEPPRDDAAERAREPAPPVNAHFIVNLTTLADLAHKADTGLSTIGSITNMTDDETVLAMAHEAFDLIKPAIDLLYSELKKAKA